MLTINYICSARHSPIITLWLVGTFVLLAASVERFFSRLALMVLGFMFFLKAVSLVTLCREGPFWPEGRHRAREKFEE